MNTEAADPSADNRKWGVSSLFELYWTTGTLGTYMSLFFTTVSIVLSIILQQYAHTWDNFATDCPAEYNDSCRAESAVLRVSFTLTVIFMAQILGTMAYTRYYDYLWVVKALVYIALLVACFYMDASVFGLSGYAWFARILGFFYVIVQAIIIIDVAYSWNEKWLAYSKELNGGKMWVWGLVLVSAVMYAVSGIALGYMFWFFGGCPDSDTILALTVIFPVVVTVTQVFFTDDNGSLLTSAIMTGYAVYVCYSAVSLNPNETCNPTISTDYQTISTIIGLAITAVGILWTAHTAITRVPLALGADHQQLQLSDLSGNTTTSGGNPYASAGLKSLFTQVSLLYLCISGYYAMVLTNWATVQEGGSLQSPSTGKTAMWIQAAGQWISMLLYLWTLVAPKLFPDRDFT